MPGIWNWASSVRSVHCLTFLPVVAGYLGDRLGRRRLYFLSIFAVGSATLLLTAMGTIEGILPSKWSWGSVSLPGYAIESGLTPSEVGLLLSGFGFVRMMVFSLWQIGRNRRKEEHRVCLLRDDTSAASDSIQ